MRGMWWVVVVVGVVVGVATYVTWTAARVDRLHRRASSATAALDAQLGRRANAAAALGEAAGRPGLTIAANGALGAHPAEREAAENDLTRQLRAAVSGAPAVFAGPGAGSGAGPGGAAGPDSPTFAELVSVSRRVALARQMHTDVVRDALAVRLRRPVRLFRLARRHPQPAYFDVDDPSLDGASRVPVAALPGPRPRPRPADIPSESAQRPT